MGYTTSTSLGTGEGVFSPPPVVHTSGTPTPVRTYHGRREGDSTLVLGRLETPCPERGTTETFHIRVRPQIHPSFFRDLSCHLTPLVKNIKMVHDP